MDNKIDSIVGRRLLQLATEYAARLQEGLGGNLVSVVLFGSVARGEATPNSDLDLLIVMEDLPRGRFRRLAWIEPVEATFAAKLDSLEEEGIYTRLATVLKTRKEAERVVPLYLDMVEDAIILYDKGDFFHHLLSNLRQKPETLGARRLQMGRVRYWDLKPDLKPGERFQI
jgi:predicted nucleotidyltransferase